MFLYIKLDIFTAVVSVKFYSFLTFSLHTSMEVSQGIKLYFLLFFIWNEYSFFLAIDIILHTLSCLPLSKPPSFSNRANCCSDNINIEPLFKNPLISVCVINNCNAIRAKACHKCNHMLVELSLAFSSHCNVVSSGSPKGTNEV